MIRTLTERIIIAKAAIPVNSSEEEEKVL